MSRFELNGEWTLRYGRQERPSRDQIDPDVPSDWPSILATVPGNVELDLIQAGELPADLDHAHNIYLLRDLEGHQWWYQRTFELEKGTFDATTELVLAGVDTLASVWLNGAKVGTLANMLVPHRLVVGPHLLEGTNDIVIGIDSAVEAAREIPVEAGSWAMENNWESLHLRKAAHSFGWDIMPRAVSAGLWRDVFLETPAPVRFRDVYLATPAVDTAERTARLMVRWDLASPLWPLDGWSIRLTVQTIGGSSRPLAARSTPVLCSHGQIQCDVPDVDLWWPRGAGPATLHEIRLELVDTGGQVATTWTTRYGFRTIRLDSTATLDEQGNGRFHFVVNGVELFVKGTNWVPLDAFHSRDASRLAETHAMLVDLNCTMVRCWGGNIYESEAFFRLCDETGIMVWQDFAFGCALYPQTPEFHARVRAEAETIIPLLRNHCSLALWAGNNEVDAFYPFAKPGVDPNRDDRISREILATACRRLDPHRDYLPSSPYFSPELWALGIPHDRRPEDHLWGPRDDFKGAFYSSSNALFASEIGYHGCPARSSLERMMSPQALWPWPDNEEWLTHAVRPLRHGTAYNFRIKLMADQCALLFGEAPTDLDDFIFASQVSQAEALKYFIERFRLEKGRRSGILWWNLRDGWPEISDAIVDYYGARKLAYAVVRRVQQDVCVMIDEPRDGRHPVVAVNDTLRPVSIQITIRNGETNLLSAAIDIPVNGKAPVGSVPAADHPAFFQIAWELNGEIHRNHYLAGPRPFDVRQCRSCYPGFSSKETVL